MNKITRLYCALPNYLLSTLVIATVLAFTLMPVPERIVPDVDNADKVAHFAMFGAIACLMWLDVARQKRTALLWSQYFVVAIISGALGGVIELLQGTDFVNRSCDFYDFLADAAGAFVLPLLFRKIISKCLPANRKVCLRTVTTLSEQLERVYLDSFPPEERREWNDIALKARDKDEPLQFTEVMLEGKPVGLISWWDFGQFAYLEHFAVDGAIRGGGIGASALCLWLKDIGMPAVLEVELPDANDMASRRIGFYERLGFKGHSDWLYVQPPYRPGLPSVPLMLMTYGDVCNLKEVETVLHTQVYGVKR